MLCEKPLQKIGFRRALLLIKPDHTGHHPGAVPGFRPSPGNSEETTTRVSTEEISVLSRVPTWDPTHPGSPVSRALPGNTPTQGPTRESEPGFFLGGGGNPGRNPGHGLGKTRERGGFRVFPGWYCWGLWVLERQLARISTQVTQETTSTKNSTQDRPSCRDPGLCPGP